MFFCNFCGEPFSGNRPDILGSLVETGELNRVYDALSSGIGETVSMIALFRGLGKGLDTFLDSVKKVKHSEDTYPQLRKLIIAVPGCCAEFAKQLGEIESNINPDFHALHPLTFAEQLKQSLDRVLTEKKHRNILHLRRRFKAEKNGKLRRGRPLLHGHLIHGL